MVYMPSEIQYPPHEPFSRGVSSSGYSDDLPVSEHSEENPAEVGFWVHLHFAMIQCGYEWSDETDACLKGMKNRQKSLDSYRGADTAREEYNRLKAKWEDYEEKLEEWLAEHPTDEAEV
jgi:hypothetical protein